MPLVEGTRVSLLLRRNSPLKRNACDPRVQLKVSEKVHVGVFSYEVPVREQAEAALVDPGGRWPLWGLQKLNGLKSVMTPKPFTSGGRRA